MAMPATILSWDGKTAGVNAKAILIPIEIKKQMKTVMEK